MGSNPRLIEKLRRLRLDDFVHNHPQLYRCKLKIIKYAKRSVYIMILQDKKISKLLDEIEHQNHRMIEYYFKRNRVLEVGCGEGSFLSYVSKNKGCECVGIDISERMIKSARTTNMGPKYAVMDSGELGFKNKEFDVVVFKHVLHHVRQLDKTIEESKRVGNLIIIYESCPWETQPFKMVSRAYWKLIDRGHEYLSLNEWQARFGLPVLAEIRGRGLVRSGICVLRV
jgi:SAM-dependent methyltransferase